MRILRASDDPLERREAWEASKTIGAVVADDVRELARLRNEAARSLGYRDWFALSLETSELDETRLFATLHEVDAATAEPFARWKAELDATLGERFTVAPAELRPGTTTTRSSRSCRSTAESISTPCSETAIPSRSPAGRSTESAST